jgi:hypothetical protein
MGIKGGKNGNNMGFGNLCNLKPVVTAVAEEKDPNNIPKTRIIRISERLYRRVCAHQKKYYKDVEPYETLLENLLDCYDKQDTENYNHYHWNK